MKPWEMNWSDESSPADQKPWEKDWSRSHKESISMTPQREPSKFSDIPSGFMRGLETRSLGGLQRFWELTGDPRADLIREDVKESRKAEEIATTRPSILNSISNVAGEVAPEIGASVALGPSTFASALIGTLGGLLRPTESNRETAINAAIEGSTAAGFSALRSTIAPRPKIEPEHMASIRAGQREGMRFTGGQIADNPIVQRSEAHAKWNPLFWTKWHAIGVERQQDNQFVRGLLKQAGVPENAIPKNPSLSPELIEVAHRTVGDKYEKIFPSSGTFDVSNSSQPSLWRTLRSLRPNNLNLIEDDKRIVADTARQVRQIIYQNNGKVPARLYQEAIELVDESFSRLTDDGAKVASKPMRALYEELLNVLPDKKAYLQAQADYAKLMSVEDLLRRSKGMGTGVPDRAKLGSVVERNMPGGVIRNRSTMADLARGGQASVGVGALPDRSTGLPVPSDVPNLLTYWRWNNPVAIRGMLNPRARDITDNLSRYLPGSFLQNIDEFKEQ